jgi:hypothetical protein
MLESSLELFRTTEVFDFVLTWWVFGVFSGVQQSWIGGFSW